MSMFITKSPRDRVPIVPITIPKIARPLPPLSGFFLMSRRAITPVKSASGAGNQRTEKNPK